MNVQFIKEVCDVMSPFMSEHGYSAKDQDTGCFKGEFKAYKVAYNSEASEFTLSVAPVGEDGIPSEYSQLTSWYFNEEDHGDNDTACIGEDFVSAVAADNGVKLIKSVKGVEEVALPTKAAAGTAPGVEAFAQKFLAMFPQYKDAYKENVAKYGEFLYVDFFKRYGVRKMQELMKDEQKNKKALGKYWGMLGTMHYEGETLVGDIICAVIIAGTFGNDPAAFDAAAEKYLGDYPFLKTAGAAAARNYKKDKKLRQALSF